jgi:hypothetical protein
MAEEMMGQEDQRATATGCSATANAMEYALSALNTASKNMQAMAGECFEISKQSFEHATQTMEKLRGAHSMDELVAIQTNYVKEAFENAAEHARKFGELMAVFPSEITKTYQDVWLKSVNTAVQTMQTATQTASDSVDSYAEAARRTVHVFEHRESA